jgi:hypothetical protein
MLFSKKAGPEINFYNRTSSSSSNLFGAISEINFKLEVLNFKLSLSTQPDLK